MKNRKRLLSLAPALGGWGFGPGGALKEEHMENFVYEYPTRALFGKGAAKEHLGRLLDACGPNVMLAYGGGPIHKNGVYGEMREILDAAGKAVTEFHGITPNPTYAKVQEGAALAREKGIHFILAVGGGSVITHEGKKVKTGIFAAAPRFAVLDPGYTMSVPFAQVMSGAFDTLSHAMGTYFGRADRDNASDDIAEAVKRNTIRNMQQSDKRRGRTADTWGSLRNTADVPVNPRRRRGFHSRLFRPCVLYWGKLRHGGATQSWARGRRDGR